VVMVVAVGMVHVVDESESKKSSNDLTNLIEGFYS
jgi:hypothetical protein